MVAINIFLVFKNRLMLNNCINFRKSLKFQKVTEQRTKTLNKQMLRPFPRQY